MEKRYYIFELNEHVERENVFFENRYGLTVAGDLYKQKDLDLTKTYPALIIGAPYGGVKEQGPGIYANELAQRGFIVLTFDQSFMGDSSGFPRHVSSPDIFVENFSAAVDYLGLLDIVDREKIGVVGICGSGGFALSAAQVDMRIKAVATASLYDMTYCARENMSKEDLAQIKEQLSRQRWEDAKNAYPEYIPSFPLFPANEMPANLPAEAAIWFEFYGLKRGHHPHARGGFTSTSQLAMMNFDLLSHLDEISPRPVLLIVGDRAHSKRYSEIVYEKVLQPKELYVVEDANHVDLYDRIDRIPFHKLEDFFKTSFSL